MLQWDQPDVVEGLVTYRDDTRSHMYYVMPNQPRFRIDDNGLPVFKFLKYRFPIDHPNGKKGGGFLICDVEFTVPSEQLEKVKLKLQERVDQQWQGTGRPAPQVQIGQLSYTRGTASVQFLDSGGALVEKIQNPGSPSLYGKMITPITIEMSPEGATLAEAALQDKGGVLQVVYDIWTPVKLPPLTATVWFDAGKFMEFHQHVEIDWSMYGEDDYREQVSEQFRSSESSGVIIDPGTVTDQKIINAVTDWAWSSLEDAVKRMVLGDIAPVSEDDRKVPDGIDNLWRDVSVSKVASFRRTFTQGQVMEWNPAPRGTLPNITTLTGKDGKVYKWEDFAKTVDLDDPFFRSLNVTLRANADFEQLPIHSIEAHVAYQEGNTHQIGEYSFQDADDVGKFASFIENDNWKYKYWYEVNYEGESQTFKSEEQETDERILTINVDDTGVLAIDVQPGDLNFNQVAQAQVTLQYEDQANGVEPIEEVFTLDKDHQHYRLQKLIFQPRRNPYHYSVKYFMQDGKEFQSGEPLPGRSPRLNINDPFSATKTIGLRAMGDFDTRIDTVFVDLQYIDETNDYNQNKSIALSKTQPFFDWSFPVIGENSGKIVYSGTIRYKDGSAQPIKEETTTKNTIMIGEVVHTLDVLVLSDLVDFSQVKLAKVSLHYEDPANAVDERKDLIFRPNATAPGNWSIKIKDKLLRQYTWQATYYMTNGSSRLSSPEPQPTSDSTIILEVPA